MFRSDTFLFHEVSTYPSVKMDTQSLFNINRVYCIQFVPSKVPTYLGHFRQRKYWTKSQKKKAVKEF